MSTTAKEYRWVLIVSLLILALSSVPIIAGYAAQTPDQRFIGTFFDRPDYAVHLAAMHYGEQGHWNYQFRFTTEPQPTTYLKTIYVVLGHLNRWTELPAELLFQVMRFLFGLLACLSIYYLTTRIFTKTDQRRFAFFLAILGAGVGWIQMPLGLIPDHNISPMDFWLIDAYVFFAIATLPHLSLVIAALAFSVAVFLDHLERPHWLKVVSIAICAILVQFINPIAFLLADAAFAGMVAFICWKKQKVDWALILTVKALIVIQIPLLLYSLTLMTNDPAWAEYNRQNFTLSPPPIYLLLGFGLFWPFTLVGALNALYQQDMRFGWAIAWVVAAIGAAYLPNAIQRRFLLAIALPLAILATPVMLDFSTWLGEKLRIGRYTGALLVAALIALTPLLMVAAYSIDMSRHPEALFEPKALVSAADWLDQANGPSNEVVLASEPTAQLIAMRTPLRLYFGHDPETFHYREKSQAVERFYRGEQSATWLTTQGINWVIFGPHEKRWGPFPSGLPCLKIAYQNEAVTIYQVIYP